MSNFLPPPPPKKKSGLKTGQTIHLSTEQKAKNAARTRLSRTKKKAKQAQTRKENLQQKAKEIETINAALLGKKTTVLDAALIDSTAPIIQQYINGRPILFEPNPGPQTEFLAASEDQVFYGGARGGGKSFAMLVDPLRYCDKSSHRALLIRRTMPELRDLINHSLHLYKLAYPGAKWREQEKEWRFPSGARIEFGYAENMQDALRYQGQSYTWIGVDELPQYPTAEVWNFLSSSLRSTDPSIKPCMRATGNPGNIGSAWVREMFIDAGEWGQAFKVTVKTPAGPRYITRRFIPAKLQDNKYLMQTDNYITMLASLPDIQRKQFLEGNWDVFDNAAFPEFKRDIHVVNPFELPRGWIKFRAADWGYSSPACCLWFAIDNDNNLWVYRELYVKNLTADIFAYRVLDAEMGDTNMRYGVLDVSTWAKRGDIGPSIAETMIKLGCKWRPSDRSSNSRHNGKLEVHRRLRVNDLTNKPSLFVFANCTNLIRTIPQLPLDDNDPEDVDTKAEDHAYDALRYGCMSRPINPRQSLAMDRYLNAKPHTAADATFGY